MLRLLAPFLCLALAAQPTPYQKAPKAVERVLDAPGTPSLLASPSGDHFLLAEFERNPPIQALAQPMARLAGLRLNPRTRGPHNPPRLKALAIQNLKGDPARPIVLPADVALGQPRWSPDGRRFVLTGAGAQATELWVGEAATGKVHRVPGLKLNAVLGQPLDWLPDGTLLAKAVPANQGPAPKAPEVPIGPRIQETEGKAAPAPTYQDLLQNAFDETLFEFLAQSQVVRVDLATGALKPIGKPGLYADIQPSPDGKLILVARLQRPLLLPGAGLPVSRPRGGLGSRRQARPYRGGSAPGRGHPHRGRPHGPPPLALAAHGTGHPRLGRGPGRGRPQTESRVPRTACCCRPHPSKPPLLN